MYTEYIQMYPRKVVALQKSKPFSSKQGSLDVDEDPLLVLYKYRLKSIVGIS